MTQSTAEEEAIAQLIPERKDDEHCWVVRASGGRYVDHFLAHSLVAIGHLDRINASDIDSVMNLSPNQLQSILSRRDGEEPAPTKATVVNQFNQVQSFLRAMSVGDLVLTLDDSNVAIGRISGVPTYESGALDVIDPTRKRRRRTPLLYRLRRSVNWGPTLPRKRMPYALEMSLRAHQAVFSFDGHWEYLYHLVFPIFRDSQNLYFTANIERQAGIPSYSVSQYLGFLSDLEAISRSFSPDTDETTDELLKRFREEFSYELQCSAEFMSPGTLWGKLGLSHKQWLRLLYFLIGYAVLFGDISAFGVQFKGLLTEDIRKQITAHVLKRMEVRDMERVKKELQLNVPQYNVKPLTEKPITSDTLNSNIG